MVLDAWVKQILFTLLRTPPAQVPRPTQPVVAGRRRGQLSQPKEKKMKIKIPRRAPPVSLSLSSSLFCAAARTRRCRRPSSGHVPAILVRRAQPSLLSSPQDPAPTPVPSNPNPSLPLLHCRRPQAVPPPLARSGEPWLNPSLGELLLALLLRFRRSHSLNRLPAGPPPLSSARRRPCPSHRPLVAAPRLRHRR